MKIQIYNEDCLVTMQSIPVGQFDLIITSPPYNTNKKAGKVRTTKNTTVKDSQYQYVRYDSYIDNIPNDQYAKWTANLFNEFDRVLNIGGVVLYNLSYGSENTEAMFKAITAVIDQTPFTIADVIVWKKHSALPNSCSSNRLTRVCEFIYVFCRKTELMTFNCNKDKKTKRPNGQQMYANIPNIITAANNDGANPLNKATYSTELVSKLLEIYGTPGSWVYDPFMGTGTTAVACYRHGFNCIGSELSKDQTEYAIKRIEEEKSQLRFDIFN